MSNEKSGLFVSVVYGIPAVFYRSDTGSVRDMGNHPHAQVIALIELRDAVERVGDNLRTTNSLLAELRAIAELRATAELIATRTR